MGQGPHNLGFAKCRPQEVTGGSLVLLKGKGGGSEEAAKSPGLLRVGSGGGIGS